MCRVCAPPHWVRHRGTRAPLQCACPTPRIFKSSGDSCLVTLILIYTYQCGIPSAYQCAYIYFKLSYCVNVSHHHHLLPCVLPSCLIKSDQENKESTKLTECTILKRKARTKWKGKQGKANNVAPYTNKHSLVWFGFQIFSLSRRLGKIPSMNLLVRINVAISIFLINSSPLSRSL